MKLAAMCPEPRNLADVRRGEFETLLTTIDTEPRTPDFGPRLGPAGAVMIGARPVLIAYNVFLESDVYHHRPTHRQTNPRQQRRLPRGQSPRLAHLLS